MPYQIDAQKKKEILKQRALHLAQLIVKKESTSENIEVVEFKLGTERYGIESKYIREVFPLKDLTILPSAPSFISGIVNVRRRIISVIDLKKIFDIPIKETDEQSKIIILENESMEFGILTEGILGVSTIPLESLQPPIATLTGVKLDFFKGISSDRMIVLDGLKLLTSKKLIVEENVE